jgi:hypothetical protein
LASLAAVAATEKGRLFQPHHAPLNDHP